MRIYDLPVSSSALSRRVGVIGSCRVNTPFVKLEERPAARRLWMDFAVTHTTAEAIQNLEVLSGALPPPVVLPFIFEPPQVPTLPGDQGELLASIDTYLVEISDRTVVRAGDWVLQINFLFRNLVQKHPAALFQWYKELTTAGAAQNATVTGAVERLRSANVENLDHLADILRFAKLERQTAQQLADDVRILTSRRPARWIFASHFLAPGDEGAIMKDRRELIEGVRSASAAAGAEFFDVSALVERHGRQIALAADGADIFEYAEPFNEVVASALLDVLRHGDTQPRQQASTAMASTSNPKSLDAKVCLQIVEREMVALHAKRLAKLGRDESGLFEHYEGLVRSGAIFLSSDVDRLAYVLDYLPPYDRYIVYRAGLGELGFALALAGRPVTVWEPNGARRQAIRDVFDQLAKKHDQIRRNFELADVPVEEVPLGNGKTLGLAFSLLLINEGADEEAAARSTARTDAILYSPRHFLRSRSEQTADAEARVLLRKAGYQTFEVIPLVETVLAKRSANAEIPNQGRLRFVAAG